MHPISPTSRAALLSLVLTLTVSLLAALVPAPQAAHAAPPSGWVKADVVGGGCDAYGRCSSEVTPGSATLYEYRPDRHAAPRSYAVNDSSLAYHGGYSTFERRERCTIGGVQYYWSAGTWHHGGYWTLTYTASGGERWIGPSREHWAFFHQDVCEPTGPNARTATPLPLPASPTPPGFIATATPPGGPPSTPTLPPQSLPTPTTPATPTSVPVCFAEQGITTGMGISAVQGSTQVNYQSPVGYHIPVSDAGSPQGLYDDGYGGNAPWPVGRAAAPVAAGQPLDVRFALSSVSMNNPRENPLEPFTQWGAAKMFMFIKDLGTELASSGDDRLLFNLGSDAVNPSNGAVQNGNTIVQVQQWQVASGVEVLGPQTFSSYTWGAQRWWEQLHSTDSGRGDYAPPSDPGWPRTTPDIGWGRNSVRSPSTMALRFTPEPGHTYEVLSRIDKKSCGVWHSNFRLMRLTTVEPIDIGITMEHARITTPGSEITYRLIYENTRTDISRPFRLTYTLPNGVTVRGFSRTPSSQSGSTITWDLPALPGQTDPAGRSPQSEIAITVAVNQNAPETLFSVATVAMEGDSNPTNNRAEGTTRVVYLPAPQATFRLRIHSDLDPQQGIYTSSGMQISWPANEVLDFLPAITLQPVAQPGDGSYQVSQRVAGWSLEQVGATQIARGAQCKPGTAPSGADIEGADLGAMPGCLYQYIASPTVADMRGMAHSYWSQSLPGAMRSDVYVWTPLPSGPTQLVLNYAVLTTAQENGVDLDGDGSTAGILARRTTVTRGAFQVTLLAPRSRR